MTCISVPIVHIRAQNAEQKCTSRRGYCTSASTVYPEVMRVRYSYSCRQEVSESRGHEFVWALRYAGNFCHIFCESLYPGTSCPLGALTKGLIRQPFSPPIHPHIALVHPQNILRILHHTPPVHFKLPQLHRSGMSWDN